MSLKGRQAVVAKVPDLGNADCFSLIVHEKGLAVVAAWQQRKRSQDSALPNGGQALAVSAKLAKVFAGWAVADGRFGEQGCQSIRRHSGPLAAAIRAV